MTKRDAGIVDYQRGILLRRIWDRIRTRRRYIKALKRLNRISPDSYGVVNPPGSIR